MDIVQQNTKEQIRTDLPEYRVGDTVKVHYKIREGSKERIQVFQGIVLQKKGMTPLATLTSGIRTTGLQDYGTIRHEMIIGD